MRFSGGWAALNPPMAARSFWTKSANCPARPKWPSCGCCKSGNLNALGVTSRFPWMFESSRLRIVILRPLGTGAFRSDLFYRLNVFPIEIPSLRQRRDDIPLLVEYLIERYAKRAGKRIRKIEKKTLELFQAYDWPGNVRELQNVVERAVLLCDDETFSVDESWLKQDMRRDGRSATAPASRVRKCGELPTTVI